MPNGHPALTPMPRLVVLSDCHGQYGSLRNLPDGDILIDCGDWTARDDQGNIIAYLRWLESQPHPHKVFIAGNHQLLAETQPDLFAGLRATYAPSCVYLNDSGEEVEGLKLWGSPVTPRFGDLAFNRDRGAAIRAHRDLIPSDTQVLITHGPALGILDKAPRHRRPGAFDRVGCADLKETINTRLKSLRLHGCGHVHAAFGRLNTLGTVFVNASVVDETYTLTNPPTVIDL